MDRAKCEICERKLVLPGGPIHAEIFVAGEFPGHYELIAGYPFVPSKKRWNWNAGKIIRKEFGMAGIPFQTVRTSNLWLHGKTNECVLDHHIERFIEEMKGRRFALLMGSDIADTFNFDSGITGLSGLEVEHPVFPRGTRVMLCVNPATASNGPHGELRLAVNKFADMIRSER